MARRLWVLALVVGLVAVAASPVGAQSDGGEPYPGFPVVEAEAADELASEVGAQVDGESLPSVERPVDRLPRAERRLAKYVAATTAQGGTLYLARGGEFGFVRTGNIRIPVTLWSLSYSNSAPGLWTYAIGGSRIPAPETVPALRLEWHAEAARLQQGSPSPGFSLDIDPPPTSVLAAAAAGAAAAGGLLLVGLFA